jgi:8-oxo-dGTP pyrophosphatase MutT (NUDIX family)
VPYLPWHARVDVMILQAAAIPMRKGKICLVTSRNGSRWVIPKGCLEPGKSEIEIAAQEAWEEAGLRGSLGKNPVGSYHYEKWGDELQVAVYLLEVLEIADDWPEKATRLRAWLPPKDAVERLAEADLRAIVLRAFGAG